MSDTSPTPEPGAPVPETPDPDGLDIAVPAESAGPDDPTAVTDRPPLLVGEDLVAGYLPGVDILNGCDVVLGQGELVGIIGPNGAGKSTLIKTVFGLVPVRRGRVVLGDQDITSFRADQLVAAVAGDDMAQMRVDHLRLPHRNKRHHMAVEDMFRPVILPRDVFQRQ